MEWILSRNVALYIGMDHSDKHKWQKFIINTKPFQNGIPFEFIAPNISRTVEFTKDKFVFPSDDLYDGVCHYCI